MRSTIDCFQLYCSRFEAAICAIIASTSARVRALLVSAVPAAVVVGVPVGVGVPVAVGVPATAGVPTAASGCAVDFADDPSLKIADMMLPNILIVSSWDDGIMLRA